MNSHPLSYCFEKTKSVSYVTLPKVGYLRRCSCPHLITPRSARILSQIEKGGVVPVEIFIQTKGEEAPSDALVQFSKIYLAQKRVCTLLKETPPGKLLADWHNLVNKAATKPELVDMGPAISGFMAVKDSEELVRLETIPEA